jgi:hypothetical protein
MNSEHRKILEELWLGKVGASSGGIAIRDEEVAHFLCKFAEIVSITPCLFGASCEACNLERAIWWDWCNSLAGPVRIRLQRVMRDCGIPLPPGPWEEVPTNAVPTPFN